MPSRWGVSKALGGYFLGKAYSNPKAGEACAIGLRLEWACPPKLQGMVFQLSYLNLKSWNKREG